MIRNYGTINAAPVLVARLFNVSIKYHWIIHRDQIKKSKTYNQITFI